MIVKRAQKEEKGNVQFVEERIKRAARLLKGQKDEEGEGDVKESSDDLVPEEEEDDGDDEVERQEKIDRLLGDLTESKSKSSFSNPRLTALRQRRLKLLLGEDSDSSSSDSETSGAVTGSIGTKSMAGNPSNQSEPVLDGSNPGPSCGLKVGKPESVNQGEDFGSLSGGAIECNSRQPESDIRGHSGPSGLHELSEAGPSGTNDGSGASREKVKFKKSGSKGGGGRSIRKRSHDED